MPRRTKLTKRLDCIRYKKPKPSNTVPHDEAPEAAVSNNASEPAIVREHEANGPIFDLAVDFETAEEAEGFQGYVWHSDAGESESNVDSSSDSDHETDPEEHDHMPLRGPVWQKSADELLKGMYGAGSRSTSCRAKRKAIEMANDAAKYPTLSTLWKKQRTMGSSVLGEESTRTGCHDNPTMPIANIRKGSSTQKAELQKARKIALADISELLRLSSKQEQKYGERLKYHENFYWRHVMVQQFLQQQMCNHGPTPPRRRTLAIHVAQSFARGHSTARKIVQWEKRWITDREIPKRAASPKTKAAWMDNEKVIESIRGFAARFKDSRHSPCTIQQKRVYITDSRRTYLIYPGAASERAMSSRSGTDRDLFSYCQTMAEPAGISIPRGEKERVHRWA